MRPMRLSRKFSMNQRAEFARVRDLGKSRSGRYVVLSVLDSQSLKHPKFGFITTKKTGKAHQRNYLRRVFRAVVQKHGDGLKSNVYVVTIARWRAKDATYQELEKEWLKLAAKLQILPIDTVV